MIKNRNAGARIVAWDSRGARGKSIAVQGIGYFDARGMRPIYGREDIFGRLRLHMNVWINSKGRVFARFWSRNEEVDLYSYEVTGLRASINFQSTGFYNEHLVPECLRSEYYNWVLSEMPFIW